MKNPKVLYTKEFIKEVKQWRRQKTLSVITLPLLIIIIYFTLFFLILSIFN